MSRSADVKTPLGRFAFTHSKGSSLFEHRANKQGRKQYGCSILFPKGVDISALQNAAVEAAVEEWGDKAKQMIKDGLIKSPFLDGDGKQGKSKETGEPHEGFPGTTFIRVVSGEDYKPKIVNQKVLPIVDPSDFYSGVWGFAVVNAFTWENDEQGKGLSFGISMAQKVKDGDRLGGSGEADPEKAFEVIPDEGDALASTKTGDGAAGLFA